MTLETVAEGSTSNSSESAEPPKSSKGRTFRDGVRKIDLVLVVKDEENIIADTMRNNFLTNITKMGLEIEYENGVLPINRKLVFFKIHCPNDVLNNLGTAFGVKSVQSARAVHMMTYKEREWINLVRKNYVQPLQYSSLDRSLVVYMILLNVPFGDRQNHIGLERLMKRNIVIDAYALHDGPYFIPRDAPSINARQILFYNWAGIRNIFTRQPLNVIHEYFGPKVALYFAFYGLYNLFLAIASIIALITLYFAEFRNQSYTELRDPLCKTSDVYICSDCPPGRSYCYVTEVKNFCQMYAIYILVDNKYTQFFSTLIILWATQIRQFRQEVVQKSYYTKLSFVGVFLSAFWIGREKYLNWVWETQNKEYNKKQIRPEYRMNLSTPRKSNKTGIAMIGESYYAAIMTLLSYIGIILLTASVFAIFLTLRKTQDREYIIKNKIYKPETLIPSLIYTMIGFSILLCIVDLILRKVAYYIVQVENNRTYESLSWSHARHLYAMCFILPMLILGYFGFHSAMFKLRCGFERFVYDSMSYGHILFFNMCVMTSCIYELSIAFTIVLLLRYVLLRKFALYSSLTDYNRRGRVQRVPCWEREFALSRFDESALASRMTILVMQFTLIMAYGFAFPPAIIIVLFFNVYDMRRDAELCTLYYRRPLHLKNRSFNVWSKILKLMVYLGIIVNVVALICTTDTIEAYLMEDRREPGYFHVASDDFHNLTNKYQILTVDELRTFQYSYILIFEIVMFTIFLLLQYIFAVGVDELVIPRKLHQQQNEAQTLQNITLKD